MNGKTVAAYRTGNEELSIRQERLDASDYIEFLSRTDLGKQYPREDFTERIAALVKNTQISLVARDKNGRVVGTCFGLTDFAYWLLVPDIGIDRGYAGKGIGRKLMELAREAAGGEKRTVVFVYANEEAVGFYKKIGIRPAKAMMENVRGVKWTEFAV
jgi:predicted N-acetyltransferase YhbS